MTYIAIGAFVSFALLLPVASWLAIGRIRRRGLPPGTRRAIREARLQLPDDP